MRYFVYFSSYLSFCTTNVEVTYSKVVSGFFSYGVISGLHCELKLGNFL